MGYYVVKIYNLEDKKKGKIDTTEEIYEDLTKAIKQAMLAIKKFEDDKKYGMTTEIFYTPDGGQQYFLEEKFISLEKEE